MVEPRHDLASLPHLGIVVFEVIAVMEKGGCGLAVWPIAYSLYTSGDFNNNNDNHLSYHVCVGHSVEKVLTVAFYFYLSIT